MKASVALVALLSWYSVGTLAQTVPCDGNLTKEDSLTDELTFVGNALMQTGTTPARTASSRNVYARESNNTSVVTQTAASRSQAKDVRPSDLAAETALSQRIRQTSPDRPAAPSQSYGHVETWCGTWWDCCVFSHLGPATGLVDDCFSVWVDDSKYGFFRVSPAVGTAVSGLLDDRYTIRIQEDRTFIVAEPRDTISAEATLGVTISRPRSRHSIYTGVGIARSGSGRAYVGYGFLIGDAAVLSVGAAIGTVKRLASTVREGDAVTVSPESMTSDNLRVAPFLSLSYRIGSARF